MTAQNRISFSQQKKHKISKTYDDNANCIFWNSKKVKDALGYPVIKAIVDPNGDLILDVGDLVTYQAIQRAKDAGVLDQVFKAIYKSNSNFNHNLD